MTGRKLGPGAYGHLGCSETPAVEGGTGWAVLGKGSKRSRQNVLLTEGVDMRVCVRAKSLQSSDSLRPCGL